MDSQREKTSVLLWFCVLVVVPRFTLIHYFDREKLLLPSTVHTPTSLLSPSSSLSLSPLLTSIIASTRCLHPQLTRLLVVLVFKHLHLSITVDVGLNTVLVKCCDDFCRRCVKQYQGKQTEDGISSFVSCLTITCGPWWEIT